MGQTTGMVQEIAEAISQGTAAATGKAATIQVTAMETGVVAAMVQAIAAATQM